jgi:hypothetical protein
MAQTISRRPVTPETLFDPRLVHVRFVLDKAALGQAFLAVLRFHCHSVNAASAFIHAPSTPQKLMLANYTVVQWLLCFPYVLYFNAQSLVNRRFFSRKLILS